MTTLKTGYVLKRYPRYSETFVVNEILAHEAAGQEIVIFALRDVQDAHFQDNLSKVRAPVIRVPNRFSGPDALWSLFADLRSQLPDSWARLGEVVWTDGRDVAQAIYIALACHARGIQHLHAHFGTVSTSVARLAAKLAGIGYSFTAHAKDIYYNYQTPQNLELKIRDASSVITVSDFNVAYLRENFVAPSAEIVRIYNGLDLQRFAYAAPATRSQGILAVGRLVEKKGFHILLESLRVLQRAGRTVRCRIIGHGEEYHNLQHQIQAASLEDCVTLTGPMSQSDVVAEMRSAAVLACPCVVGADGNRDGLPTVLLEAMALGLPCIASNVTGIPELVRDGETGLLVAEGDPESLAEALIRMLDDAQLRLDLSHAARQLIQTDFDVVRNAAALRALFQRALPDVAPGPLEGVA